LNATGFAAVVNYTNYCTNSLYESGCIPDIRLNNTIPISPFNTTVNFTCSLNSVCQQVTRFHSVDNIDNNESYKTSNHINIVFGSYIFNSSINNSNVSNGAIINNSDLNDSIVDGCIVINSQISNSSLIDSSDFDTPCIIKNSNIKDSYITSANIFNSYIDPTNVTDSIIQNSTINDATVEFSVIRNASTCDSGFEIFGATILNDILSGGQITYNNSNYFPTTNIQAICTGLEVPPAGSSIVRDGLSDDIDWSNDDNTLSANWDESIHNFSLVYYEFRNLMNNAKNFPIQSTAAHITNAAMIKLAHLMNENRIDGWIALQVHDELCTIVRESQADLQVKLLRDAMENNPVTKEISVPMIADPLIANTLAEAK